MSALSVNPPFPIFLDIDGQPLDAGYIYLGVANQATEANPIQAYWDAALTVAATQPIVTKAGFPANAGVPARVYVNSDFSIVVKNRNGFQVFSSPTCTDRFNDAVVQVDSSDVTFLQAGTGAVTRTAQAKMRDTVSVKDFGATGDGTTDDAAAIQAAVNAVSANGTVYFPPGTYAVGAAGIAVTSKTGVTLFGDGAIIKITAISTLTTAIGAATIRLSGCTRSGVRGLEINGNSIASSGIGLTGCTDCFVDGVTVYASGVSGQITSAGGGVRNSFTNNTVYSGNGTTRGMWLGNVNSSDMETDIHVAGNVVRNNPATGIVINSVGGRVEGNHCRTNEGSGVVIPGANGYSSKNLTIVGNYFIDNLFHGVQSDVVYTTAADLTDSITVTGNVCSQNNRGTGTGIYAVNSQRWVISNNVCNDNVTAGIQLDDRCFNVTVTGNTCNDTRSGGSRTQLIGIRRNAQSQNNYGSVISCNTCNNNTTSGISVQTVTPYTMSSATISGNQCYSNSTQGIIVAEATVGEMTKIVVSGNACQQNTTVDLRLSLRDVAIGDNTYTSETDVKYYDLTSNSATPSIPGRMFWRANNSSATAITNFVGGIEGQQIVIRAANGNTTVNHGGSIVNPGAANITITSDGYISYRFEGTVWRMMFKSF